MNHRHFIAFSLTALIALSGCASLKSVSVSQVPKNRSKPISAESSTWALFGLYFSNSFADQAAEDLKAQCPAGQISGVFTKLETRNYFLWTTRTVKAQAYCGG